MFLIKVSETHSTSPSYRNLLIHVTDSSLFSGWEVRMQPPQPPVQQPPNDVEPIEQEPVEHNKKRPMNAVNWVLAAIAFVLFVAIIFVGLQEAAKPRLVPAPRSTATTTAAPILGGGGGSSGAGSAATTTSSGGTSSGGVVPAAGSTNGTA